MLGIEISFYFIGFLSCLFLIAIILEVIERENKLQKRSKELTNEIKRQMKIKTNREETKIDID